MGSMCLRPRCGTRCFPYARGDSSPRPASWQAEVNAIDRSALFPQRQAGVLVAYTQRRAERLLDMLDRHAAFPEERGSIGRAHRRGVRRPRQRIAIDAIEVVLISR